MREALDKRMLKRKTSWEIDLCQLYKNSPIKRMSKRKNTLKMKLFHIMQEFSTVSTIKTSVGPFWILSHRGPKCLHQLSGIGLLLLKIMDFGSRAQALMYFGSETPTAALTNYILKYKYIGGEANKRVNTYLW